MRTSSAAIPAMSQKSPREIREAAGLRRLDIASRARVSETSVRVYEIAPSEVNARVRASLAPVYASIEASL